MNYGDNCYRGYKKIFSQIIADLLRKDYNSIKHWLYTM